MGEREPLVGGRNFGRQDVNTSGADDLRILTDRATQFNNEVAQLQRIADQIGTSRDSHQIRNQLRNKREECANLAKTTIQFMKKMKIEKNDKVRYDKLVTQINDIFTRCQRISQDSIQRERVTQLASPSPSPMNNHEPQYGDYSRQDNRSNFNPQPYRGEEEDRQQEKFQKTMQFQSYAVDNAILEERDGELRHLEKELTGLNEMFVDIAQMIQDQKHDVITIENNTIDASAHVEAGVKDLHKASEYQKSSRNKLCCLALIIVLILAAIGIFLGIWFGALKH